MYNTIFSTSPYRFLPWSRLRVGCWVVSTQKYVHISDLKIFLVKKACVINTASVPIYKYTLTGDSSVLAKENYR